MAHSAKYFAERLNSCLDDTSAPTPIRDRAVILSKMLGISKQQAWILLEGHTLPNSFLIQKIADEFDVDPKWLSGEK